MKYHCTEYGRMIGNDAMDIQGGKGIVSGPSNYLAQAYDSIPISITVEGANILTRSLIIFWSGAVRCHPFVLKKRKLHETQITSRACVILTIYCSDISATRSATQRVRS